MLTPQTLARSLLAALAAVTLAPLALAQPTDFVTPELLAEQLPHDWLGLEHYSSRAELDLQGGAFAVVSLDAVDDDNGGGVDLRISDLGPYAAAVSLMYEADAAAGRYERLEIGGYPAYIEHDDVWPEAHVLLDRMLLGAFVLGALMDEAALVEAVATLPLSEIAGLSSRPAAPQAAYPATGLTVNSLRAFLPERVHGFNRTSGFYAELHPGGVAHGGLDYEGDDAVLYLMIFDLGTAAENSRERLAEGGWQPFSSGDYQGFASAAGEEPRALLLVDRFRVEATAEGPGASLELLQSALEEIEWEPLARFAEEVPAPEVRLDPLLDSQPALLAGELLAGALPEEAMGLTRVDSRVESEEERGWSEVSAQALYADPSGEPVLMLGLVDAGVMTVEMQQRQAELKEVEVAGRTAHVSEEPLRAQMILGERVALLVESAPGAGLNLDDLLELLGTIDLEPLLAQLE